MSAEPLADVRELRRVPVASYRLQFGPTFTFADARRVSSYLHRLGVSEVYCSPLLQPRPGSTHGYDVCDPTRLNADLGTDDDFAGMATELAALDLGTILDIVPNHMAADPSHNPWWRDVLANGRHSRYAKCFDIDWDQPGCEQRVLVPILGTPLAEALEKGDVRLRFEDGMFWLAYFDHRVPVDPVRAGLDPSDPERLVAEVNKARPDGSSALAALLDAAPVRLAEWQATSRLLNYRRFFDITELAGLRVEDADVFELVHARVLELVRSGVVIGLRVDHPDGLWDPGAYLDRLQRASSGDGAAVYVLVEKILSGDEALPSTWRASIHGTTGYNFLNVLTRLFVDSRAEAPLVATYRELTGETSPFDEVLHQAKRDVLETAMAPELTRLARESAAWMGWKPETARRVIGALVACFPVYRTYVTARGAREPDRRLIARAVSEAVRRYPADAKRLAAVGQRLSLDADPQEGETARSFAMRFQQLTGPVQAKGLEDTACYRYPVLLSLNEVGGAPGDFGRGVAEFHRTNAERRTYWPLEMLATSTHDTKRGEDARARISVLTEMPDAWDEAVRRWFSINRRVRQRVNGRPAPSASDEYLYYQTLMGVWPATPSSAPIPNTAPPELVERVTRYMRKAVREGKTHTSWLEPNAAYETAIDDFVVETLAGAAAQPFLAAFVPLQRRVAGWGIVNSLAQVVLKIASPGVPDVYQGAELWDFNLTDPDNRRPVDFGRRRALMDRLAPWLEPGANGSEVAAAVVRLLANPEDGAIKLFVTARSLACRRARDDLFLWGDYLPLVVEGPCAAHVVAFARRRGETTAIAVVPRLASAVAGAQTSPVGAEAWGDTVIRLPDTPVHEAYTDQLTDMPVDVALHGDRLSLLVADVLRVMPVALLVSDRREDRADP